MPMLCKSFRTNYDAYLHCLSGNTLAYKPPAHNSVIILGGGCHSDNTIPYETKFTEIMERICIALAATALLTNPMLCYAYAYAMCYVNPFAPILLRICIALAATLLLTTPMRKMA